MYSILFLVLVTTTLAQTVTIYFPNSTQSVMTNGQLAPSFDNDDDRMDCSRPDLYVYQQTDADRQQNTPYQISISNVGTPSPITLTT